MCMNKWRHGDLNPLSQAYEGSSPYLQSFSRLGMRDSDTVNTSTELSCSFRAWCLPHILANRQQAFLKQGTLLPTIPLFLSCRGHTRKPCWHPPEGLGPFVLRATAAVAAAVIIVALTQWTLSECLPQATCGSKYFVYTNYPVWSSHHHDGW
jgi:hypothetical protein